MIAAVSATEPAADSFRTSPAMPVNFDEPVLGKTRRHLIVPNRKAVVRTNSTPGSVNEVYLKVLTFQELRFTPFSAVPSTRARRVPAARPAPSTAAVQAHGSDESNSRSTTPQSPRFESLPLSTRGEPGAPVECR